MTDVVVLGVDELGVDVDVVGVVTTDFKLSMEVSAPLSFLSLSSLQCE